MTDTIEHGTAALTGRKLTNALTLLVSDLADAIDTRFSHSGDKESTAYNENYLAHRSAYTALRAVLIGMPANQQFRTEVLSFVQQAWNMTEGRPDVDEIARVVIGRASKDYKPETPEQLERLKKADRKVAAPAPKAAKP